MSTGSNSRQFRARVERTKSALPYAEYKLFLCAKELLIAASYTHGQQCSAGWGDCRCFLAQQLRNTEAQLFRTNNRNKRMLAKLRGAK